MAAKKNVKTPTLEKKTPDKKTPKQRVKKEKTKLQIPKVLKLKIPTASLTVKRNVKIKNMPSKNITKKKVTKCTSKKLDAISKLELANEVARMQLVKSAPVVLSEITTRTETAKTTKTTKKRGRARKEQSEATDTTTTLCPTDSEAAFDIAPKKRKYVRKIPNAQVKKKPAVIKKNKEKKPIELPKRKMKQTKLTEVITVTVATPNQNGDISDSKIPKKTAITKPLRKRLNVRKGKLDADTSSASDPHKSPSLLEVVENPLQVKDNFIPNESPRKENVEPCTIDSRRTSMTGTSECFSWTKDISSSSSTTCVTVGCKSDDFVRIDKKLPIVKLKNIDYSHQPELTNSRKLSTDSESSSSSSSSSMNTPDRATSPNVESHSLDLSTSSVTTAPSKNSHDSNKRLINTALDRLTAKLKNFDLEIINWIGYDDPITNVDINQHKICRLFKEETEVISHCQRLKQLLSDNNEENRPIEFDKDNRSEVSRDIVYPCNDSGKNKFEQELTNNVSIVNNDNGESPSKAVNEKADDCENNIASEKYRYTNFERSYDDDDALSLFAESITGIESSKMNTSAASTASLANNGANGFEEYVPQPLSKERWESSNKISYVPSKILCNEIQSQDNRKPVCEKQTADSTSITKQNLPFDIENIQNTTVAPAGISYSSRHNKFVVVERRKMPCLISSLYKLLPGVKSVVFRGVCFYNLLSSCKNPRCRYPHIILDHKEITMKLLRLSEDAFIQEYMLLRNWPALRRLYGMCFVEECKRRELTRVLVEMAIDFYIKANINYREDSRLKVVVMECTLLYLNGVNLATCDDLLLYSLQPGTLLCDEFMKTIAHTQNFSRFKQVFINLTKFIVNYNRTFDFSVATQILERVCILPCEQALSEALLEVLKHTDRAVFENSMIGIFEKQLMSLNKNLHENFLACKEAISKRVVMNPFEVSPCVNNTESEPVINTLVHTERERRYTSPDTTNLDNMNKSTDAQPTITRTVDFNRPRHFGVSIQRSFSNPNSPGSNEGFEERAKKVAAAPAPNFQAWKGQSLFDKLRGLSSRPPPVVRPPPGVRPLPGVRPPLLKRSIHQNFGPSPPKFPRRTGQDFF